MAIPKTHPKTKSAKPRSPIFILTVSIACIAVLYLVSSLLSITGFSLISARSIRDLVKNPKNRHALQDKYLYWGSRIDCPGKHCDSCEGLGHQESSIRCALEEALFLGRIIPRKDETTPRKYDFVYEKIRKYTKDEVNLPRRWKTFVMPSRMCINPIHNKKGILHQSSNLVEEGWTAKSCAMDSLYDLDLISDTVPVILDNSKVWHHVLATSMKLGSRGIAHVQGISRADLKENAFYSNLLLINRTASPLSWFMECKDRNNRSSVMLPYSFLPSVAAKKLRDAAKKIKELLGDYDAIHVRRGDKLKTRKDRFGVDRSLHPHLDRDTHPEFILCRISKWVPPGRTLFIASNERTPAFFSPLAVRYKLDGDEC
ncbi:hypothetical protein OROHE_015935 [Orobanche hederae]